MCIVIYSFVFRVMVNSGFYCIYVYIDFRKEILFDIIIFVEDVSEYEFVDLIKYLLFKSGFEI